MDPLANMLVARFGGPRQRLLSEVEQYVSFDTIYLPKHMRATLKQLEAQKRILVAAKKIDGSLRRANTFPPGTLISFAAEAKPWPGTAKHRVLGR
jgi:hypothetical protein